MGRKVGKARAVSTLDTNADESESFSPPPRSK